MKNQLLRLYSWLQKRIAGIGSFGSLSMIRFPYKIWNPAHLSIGRNVFIGKNSFFAITTTESNTPKVHIGDNVSIGANFFLASIDEIVIEENVLISDRVFISDHIHGYEDISLPIIDQALQPRGKVLIKSDAFIGINAVIMPGVTIGKHAVVGASAVVTQSVPDFTVVAGNPAKIIKQYNPHNNTWEKK